MNVYFNNKIMEELDDTKDDAIVFKKTNAQSLNNDGVNIEHIIKKYLNFIDMTDRNEEPLVLWNCFYCNKGFMDNMIEKGILDLICNNKDISCSYERILGTYFHRNLENVKEINPETYHKIFLKQL